MRWNVAAAKEKQAKYFDRHVIARRELSADETVRVKLTDGNELRKATVAKKLPN